MMARAIQAESGGAFEIDYSKPVTAKGVCLSTKEGPRVEDDCTSGAVLPTGTSFATPRRPAP